MLEVQLAPLRIAGRAGSLSKGQKTFNSQIQQIEKLRSRLAAWEAVTAAYQQKYVRELVPLLEAELALQVKLVHALDQGIRQQGLSRRERSDIAEAIVELAAEILEERDDASVKALYKKHSRSDCDSDETAELQAMKDFLEDAFGLELGEDDELESPEELIERARAQFEQKHAEHEAERQHRRNARARRKGSRRELDEQRRTEIEARQVTQSIREVYRKLASALHPDREPDPQERARKTMLMQRMNQAYEKRDLMQLLELQVELEQIDRAAIGRLDAERLRHYNAVLKEQILELHRELSRVKDAFQAQFGVSRLDDARPDAVLLDLSQDVLIAQRANRELEQDIAGLATRQGVKAWLRKLRRRTAEYERYVLRF